MRRYFRWDKKYLYWGITAFCVIASAILFFMALNYWDTIKEGITKLFRILSPFIWGLVIAYLLNPLVKLLNRKAFAPLFERILKKKPELAAKVSRGTAVVFAEVIMLVLITGLFFLIIPQLYSSIETIVVNSPTYIDSLTKWATKMLDDYPEISSYVEGLLATVNTDIVSWLQTTILPKLGNLISNVSTGVRYVLQGVYNLVIGIIVSVYVLGNTEGFVANASG
jgi:predicted PurR-regulated permease PerM